MRDTWMLLLFIVGLLVGGVAGAVYHQVKVRSYVQLVESREQELVDLRKQLKLEASRAKNANIEAAEHFDALQREYDSLQVQLAEQKRIAALQREQLSRFVRADSAEPSEQVDEVKDTDVEPEPLIKEDGRLPGGKVAYHNLKMSPVEGEFQINGEIENLSKKRFRSLILHLELFGPGSKSIAVLPIAIDGLEPGARRAFSLAGLTDRPDLYDKVRTFKITTALLQEDPRPPAEISKLNRAATRREP